MGDNFPIAWLHYREELIQKNIRKLGGVRLQLPRGQFSLANRLCRRGASESMRFGFIGTVSSRIPHLEAALLCLIGFLAANRAATQ